MKPKRKSYIRIWMAALFLFAPLAFIQTSQAQDLENPFMQHHDQNKDGKVSLDEFTKSHQENFNRIDQNGDGQIDKTDRTESGKPMRMMGRTILKHMDANNDQIIPKSEFTAAVGQRFKQLDKDQNGVIDGNEVPMPKGRHYMMRVHGIGIMKQLDANADGKISRDEFNKVNEDRFNRMDQNKDGQIDETELSGFRHHGNEPM